MPVLIMTAVSSEREAVLRGVDSDPRFVVLAGGVGSAAAAVNTVKALAAAEYRFVLNAGIGGGFPGQAEVGSLVVASEIVAADLGVETTEGFSSLEELGFGSTRIQPDAGLADFVIKALQAAKLPVTSGPILTVSTVTGSTVRGRDLAERISGAAAEAMEGFGVGCAALAGGLPVLEIRAISNLVGPRDRSAWRIKEALDLLANAASIIRKVIG